MSSDPFSPTAVDEGDFDIDLSQASSEVIPEGPYVAECTGVVKGISQKGNSQLIWDFKICGDMNGKRNEQTGKVCRPLYTALTPAALWKLEEVLTALRVAAAGQKVGYKHIKENAPGNRCLINIKHSDYNGRPQANIDALKEYNGGVEVGSDGLPF